MMAKPSRELRSGEVLASRIEEDEDGGRVEFEFAKRCSGGFAQFAHFDRRVVANARYVIVEERADFSAARFAEHDETNLHGGLGLQALGACPGRSVTEALLRSN